MVEPGYPQKGTSWQKFPGDCLDPAVRKVAKKNLLQGLVRVFGQDMGMVEHDVGIECGETDRRKQRSNLVKQVIIIQRNISPGGTPL